MEKIKLHVISAWTPEKNDLLNERGILRVSWAIEDFISILNSYNSKSNLGGLADILFRDCLLYTSRCV